MLHEDATESLLAYQRLHLDFIALTKITEAWRSDSLGSTNVTNLLVFSMTCDCMAEQACSDTTRTSQLYAYHSQQDLGKDLREIHLAHFLTASGSQGMTIGATTELIQQTMIQACCDEKLFDL